MTAPAFFIFGAGYSGRAFAARDHRRAGRSPARRARQKSSHGAVARPASRRCSSTASKSVRTSTPLWPAQPTSSSPPRRAKPATRCSSRSARACCEPACPAWAGSAISRPSASMATMAAPGSTRPANAGRSRAARCCASRPNRNGCALGAAAGLPVAVLRLSGIYGPGRNAFVNLANGTARRLVKPGQVFNRIHVDDIAGALWHLAAATPGGIFNVTDDEPAPPQDVVAYAAELMGLRRRRKCRSRPPNFRPWRGPSMARTSASPTPRSRQPGYAFCVSRLPHGLRRMWADGDWRGDGADDAQPDQAVVMTASPARAR